MSPEIRRKYWLAMMQIVDEDVILYSRAIGQPDDSKTSNIIIIIIITTTTTTTILPSIHCFFSFLLVSLS